MDLNIRIKMFVDFPKIPYNFMSRRMGKPTIGIGENKGADQMITPLFSLH